MLRASLSYRLEAQRPGAPLAGNAHLVEEALVCWRAEAEMAAVDLFGGLAEDVGGGVPEDSFPFWIVKVEEAEGARLFEWPLEVPQHVVDLGASPFAV